MMLAAFAIAGAVPAYAQGCDDVDGIAALDAKIREAYAKVATLPTAITSGKEFLEKFGTCPTTADFSTWLKGQIPDWEAKVKAAGDAKKVKELDTKFTNGLKSGTWDDSYAAGAELIAMFPDKSVNISIPLASIGLYESYKNNDKYVDQSIKYARLSLDKIKANEASLNDSWGVAPYAYGKKEDALSEMKFILGYMLYNKKKDMKGGLTYFYEVANTPGLKQTDPRMFVTAGLYALDQAKPVVAELKALSEKLNAADEEIKKAETTDERKKELSQQKIDLDKQIRAKEGYLKAWEERALDGFVRGYKNAKDVTPLEKEYRKNIYDQIVKIYESRFDGKKDVDSYIASTVAKPMVNPTTDVTPVAAPAETTTSGASAVIAKP